MQLTGIGTRGIALVREFEGLRLEAYKCPAGVWTIGFGTTQGVRPGMKINSVQAEEMLRRDLTSFETAVKNLVKVQLRSNQYDAIICFVYNIGINAFAKSTFLRKLNAKDYAGAANEFTRWNKAGGKVLPGLTRRREAEKKLFLS